MPSSLALLVEPAALFAWALAALVLVAWRGHHRASLAIAGATLFAYFVLSTPMGASLLLFALEDATAVPAGCEAIPPDALVVVLAGGQGRRSVDESETTHLTAASLRRAMAAARIGKEAPTSRFILSGGSGEGAREADLMRTFMIDLGIAPDRLQRERDSRNTWENATGTARLLAQPSPGGKSIFLLTSAMHMPRAMATFRKAGMEACPIAVDRRQEPLDLRTAWIPSASALVNSFAAAHELIGLAAYFAAGRL